MKRIISYGFWGVITVLFSLISYRLFSFIMDYKIANILSIILTKLFAYFTNKTFVFKTVTTPIEQLHEFLRFIVARSFTGVVDFVGQLLLVELLFIDDFIAKCMMIVITTILNYFLCSLGVFKKNS